MLKPFEIPLIEGFTARIVHGPSSVQVATAMSDAFSNHPLHSQLFLTLDVSIGEFIPPEKRPADLRDRVGWLDQKRVELQELGAMPSKNILLPWKFTGRIVWPAGSGVGWTVEILYRFYGGDMSCTGCIKLLELDVRCIQ